MSTSFKVSQRLKRKTTFHLKTHDRLLKFGLKFLSAFKVVAYFFSVHRTTLKADQNLNQNFKSLDRLLKLGTC